MEHSTGTAVEQAAQAAKAAQEQETRAAQAVQDAQVYAAQVAQTARAQTVQAVEAVQAAQKERERATQASAAALAAALAAKAAAQAAQPNQAVKAAQAAWDQAERATQAAVAAQAAQVQAAQAQALLAAAADGPAREVYITEYEGGAKRYEDIYRAIWQNFSYMAVLAGAILTFGKDSLGTELAAFIACLPLLFWFWATFEPLNKYGDDVGKRLSELEKALNQLVFSSPTPANGANNAPRKGMHHFMDFHSREESRTSRTLSLLSLLALVIGILIILFPYWIPWLNQPFKWYFLVVGGLILLVLLGLSIFQYVRVRIAMRMFVLLVHLLAIGLGYDWFMKANNTLASGIEVTVTSIGTQDRKIQVAVPAVPAIEPEKLIRSQKATVVVPVEATVTSVDKKNRSLQLVLPPATALELIARSQKARLIIEP